MHAFTITVILLATCVLLDENCFAQKPDVPLKTRVGINSPSPGVPFRPDGLKKLKFVPDSVSSDKLLLPLDSTRFLADAHGPVLDAAEVDPGILIVPDASIDFKILRIKPPQNIDPKMIIPRERERYGDQRP